VVARELEVLEAARHPGVVEVVGLDEGPDGPRIRTAPFDGVPLADLASLTIEEAAGTVAVVASTLADLHDLGFVHGALTAERILVRSDGRPVLCGFGHGGRAGDAPVDQAEAFPGPTDPAAVDGSPLDPAADVYALGVLMHDLADRTVAARDRADGHRSRAAGRAADALCVVADRATVAERHHRPTARALAAAIGHAVPGARLPRRSLTETAAGGEAPTPEVHPAGTDGSSSADPLVALRRTGMKPTMPPARRSARSARRATRVGGLAVSGRRQPVSTSRLGGHRLLIGVGAVAVAGVAAGLALDTSPSSPPPPPPLSEVADRRWPTGTAATTGPAPPSSGATATTVARPRPAVTAPTTPSCAPVGGPLSADTDGDGCLEALRWVDGVVEAADRRWAVGRAGDLVATGDWACGGAHTLAVLRPATGEVFVFDGWAGTERELNATARTVVEGGFALRSGDLDADGCPELLVDRSGREAVQVPMAEVVP